MGKYETFPPNTSPVNSSLYTFLSFLNRIFHLWLQTCPLLEMGSELKTKNRLVNSGDHDETTCYKLSHLGLSEILRDISTWYIRLTELRKKQIKQPHFTTECIIWLLKLEIYWKYCWKEEKLLIWSNFLFFSTIFYYLLVDFHVKTGTRFSLRDMRLFNPCPAE